MRMALQHSAFWAVRCKSEDNYSGRSTFACWQWYHSLVLGKFSAFWLIQTDLLSVSSILNGCRNWWGNSTNKRSCDCHLICMVSGLWHFKLRYQPQFSWDWGKPNLLDSNGTLSSREIKSRSEGGLSLQFPVMHCCIMYNLIIIL